MRALLEGKPRYKEIFRESRMSNVSNVSEAVVFKSGFAMKNRFMLKINQTTRQGLMSDSVL